MPVQGQITQYLVERHVKNLVEDSQQGKPLSDKEAQFVIETIGSMKGQADLLGASKLAREAETAASNRADMALGAPADVQTHMAQSRLFGQIADAASNRAAELEKANAPTANPSKAEPPKA